VTASAERPASRERWRTGVEARALVIVSALAL